MPLLNWSESKIEKKVVKYARDQGVIVRKFTSPQHRSVPDDLFLFAPGIPVFVEFKAPGKRPTSGQKREINRLIEAGYYVYVIDHPDIGIALVQYFIDAAGAPAPVEFALLST